MNIPNCTYTTEQLVKRIAKLPGQWEEGSPRWSAVSRCLMVGSTSAIAICKFSEVDPHEVKKCSQP